MDQTPVLSLSRRAARSRSSAVRDLLAVAGDPHVVSFAGGLPDPRLLPAADVASATRRVLTRDPGVLQYGPTEGVAALRDLLAAAVEGGDPRRVVVTHGAQQALHLLVAALVDPGDVVVVERPSYVGMLQELRAAGARLVTVRTDSDGMRVDELSSLLDTGMRPAFCYLNPTHQNPSGSVMSEDRRRALADLAARHGLLIVDDDAYRGLGFGHGGPSRLRDLLDDDLVVTVGSVSKTIAPGLRVGWAELPGWLVAPVVTAKQSVDLHTSTLGQHVVLDLLGRPGWLDDRLTALRALHQGRCTAMVAALRRHLDGRVVVQPPPGGLFCWVDLAPGPHEGPRACDGGFDTTGFARRALAAGVALVPGRAFDPLEEASSHVRLNFSASTPEEIDLGVTRLAAVLDAGGGPCGELPGGGARGRRSCTT